MCLRIRQEQPEWKASGTTLTPPSPERMRPRRLAGATAVALVAGLAAAAMMLPSSMQQAPAAQQSAAPALPYLEKAAASIGAAQEQASARASSEVIERTTLSGDDGVPTNTDTARTAAGGCSHEL